MLQRVEDENSRYEAAFEDKMQYLKQLEENIIDKFDQETKARKEIERSSILKIEERYNYLRNEIEKESKNRNDSMEVFQRLMDLDLPRIEEQLKEEQQEMVNVDNEISNKLNEATDSLQSMLLEERKNREETEEALLEMLKTMINSIKNQLEQEKKERSSSQDCLISLLEDLCEKLQASNDII